MSAASGLCARRVQMRGVSGPWAATPGSSIPISLHVPLWGSQAPQLQSIWWSLPCTTRPSAAASGPKAQRPGHLPLPFPKGKSSVKLDPSRPPPVSLPGGLLQTGPLLGLWPQTPTYVRRHLIFLSGSETLS